jgi:rubredoxin
MSDGDGKDEPDLHPSKEPPARPSCPSCGSAHTQPFTHAGPVARVNMKCIDCGHLFKEQRPRR